MSSKRRIRRRSCENKIPYATSEAAKTAIYAQRHKWTARMNAYPSRHNEKAPPPTGDALSKNLHPHHTFPGKERNSMIAQTISPVNTPTVPAPRQFRPEGSGLGINPARQSGRMVRATWDTHLSRVANIPTEDIEAYQQELHQERRTGYARFIARQAASSCANNLQWGGWLQAQGEYKRGRNASYSTSPQCQEIMSQAERQGYQSGLAHQRRMEGSRE